MNRLQRFSIIIVASFLCFSSLFAQTDEKKNEQNYVPPKLIESKMSDNGEGYTINFENVSVKELIGFISKIGGMNFIYNDEDVDFNITFTSDEQASLDSVIAAFIQVLKINNLSLLEDGKNLVIHKNDEVKQIPTVVSKDFPYEDMHYPPFVTRVFTIHNADVEKIASIIKPMLSTTALIEAMSSSRLLVVSDVTSNINQIARLLSSIDRPMTAMDVGSYVAQNNPASVIATLAEQLIMPLSEGVPVIISVQPRTETVFIVSTPFLIDKTIDILGELDTIPASLAGAGKELSTNNILLYQLKYKPAEQVEASLREITDNAEAQGFSSQGLVEAIDTVRYLKTTNSLLFIGPEDVLDRIRQLLEKIDTSSTPGPGSETGNFFLYKPKVKTPEELASVLDDIKKNLEESGFADPALISTLNSMRVVDSTNSLVFTGDQQSITQVKTMLAELDTAKTSQVSIATSQFYIYKIKNADEQQIENSLQALAENIKNSPHPNMALVQAIGTMQWVPETNSLIFTGTHEALERLGQIVPGFDVPPSESKKMQKSDFFMYTPQYVDPQILLDSIHDVAKKLQQSDLSDPEFIATLDDARYVSSSHSILFTGNTESLDKAKALMQVLDKGELSAAIRQEILIYTPQKASKKQMESALNQFADSLPSSDPVHEVIDNMEWIAASHSFVFRGPEKALAKIKQILTITDGEAPAQIAKTYFVYKLKYVSGDVILSDLKQMAKNLQTSDINREGLIKAISRIEWVKSTNSLFITGTPQEIDQIKTLIAEFDQSEGEKQPLIEPNSSFLMYRPKYIPAEELEVSLKSLSEDLEESGLADPGLLNTINTVRYAQSTDSLIFTGTQTSIDKVKQLLQSIDVPTGKEKGIQQIGMTTFLIYKIKYASSEYLISSLRAIADDLQNVSGSDKQLVNSIKTMRYVQETNSLIFTGPAGALEKIQGLLEKFDVPSVAEKSEKSELSPLRLPGTYEIYKPKYVAGLELINILKDFEQNLQAVGVKEEEVYDTINNLRYMESTNSIIISGTAEATQKVDQLLQRFDTPAEAQTTTSTQIETFDDVSFLMYKLQYHQGDEIETALSKIADELKQGSSSKTNERLIDAINTVQWIKITNSLIGTGDPKTLSKLRELLKSIDVPLKQVFIEVLVIQTTFAGRLEFGLQWGAQGKYKNRFGVGTGSFPVTSIDDGTFSQNLSGISATNTPTGQDIPFVSGGDLGIIGDIILHKGRTYFALGSLVNALQQDGDTTIVLNQKIVTQDNRNSQLFVGSNIPFNGSVVQTTSNATTTSANIEYRDIGVSLSITPNIGDNDILTLDIDEEISAEEESTTGLGSTDQIQTNQINGITTSKTTMSTRVHVPDKHFLVLSGMIRNTTALEKVGIPCLGGLPVIGAAFSTNSSTRAKDNVIMFIRPQILHSTEIYKNITERQEDIYRDQTKPEEFDAGIELVATPDDE